MRLALALPLAFAIALFACSASEPSTSVAAAPVSAEAGSSSSSSGAPEALECPRTRAAEATGIVSSPEISEASGIVASRANPGVYWVHNDSGDSARGFAVDGTGKLLLTLAFDTAPAVDIEDVAIGEEDGVSYLYFADIGNNAVPRTEFFIHRVKEPRVDSTGAPAQASATSEEMTFRYADGAKDAETLLFDPLTRDLLVVTKIAFGNAAVHRIGPFAAGTTATATRIAGVPIALATGGEISRDGSLVGLRNYSGNASVWRRAPGEDLAAVFARASCKVPIATETQGEAFAFLADGTGYVTISEGTGQSLNVTRFAAQ